MNRTTEKPPSQTAPKFNIRFPTGMREEIAGLAEKNGRSMNAEIVIRLKDSMPRGFLETCEDSPEYTTSVDAELLSVIGGLSKNEQKALLLLLKR